MTDVAALAALLAAHPHVTGKRDIDVACAALDLTQNSLCPMVRWLVRGDG